MAARDLPGASIERMNKKIFALVNRAGQTGRYGIKGPVEKREEYIKNKQRAMRAKGPKVNP